MEKILKFGGTSCGSIESITHYSISVFGSGNGGEDGLPVNNQITYDISLSADGNVMTAEIDYGGGWWRFVYQKTNHII